MKGIIHLQNKDRNKMNCYIVKVWFAIILLSNKKTNSYRAIN